jgi:hypothetical protein
VRRLLPLLLALTALPGCGGEPWTSGQRDEAFRLCRAEIGFPPISVFHPDDYDFKIFMCRCEVDFLAERVAYHHFADNEHVAEVNRVIQVGRTVCLMRHKGGER